MLEISLSSGIARSDKAQAEGRKENQEQRRSLKLHGFAVFLTCQHVQHYEKQYNAGQQRVGIHAACQQNLQQNQPHHPFHGNLLFMKGVSQKTHKRQQHRKQAGIADASVPPVKGLHAKGHILDTQGHHHAGRNHSHRPGQAQNPVQHDFGEIEKARGKNTQQDKGLDKGQLLCDNRGPQGRQNTEGIGTLPGIPEILRPLYRGAQHRRYHHQSLMLRQGVTGQDSVIEIVHGRVIVKAQCKQGKKADDEAAHDEPLLIFFFSQPLTEPLP